MTAESSGKGTTTVDWTGLNRVNRNFKKQKQLNILNIWQLSSVEKNISWLWLVLHESRHAYLTSFILAALKDGVRMLRTLFQRSFLNMSRQSVMGFVAKRIDCANEQERTGTIFFYHYTTEASVWITSKQIMYMFFYLAYVLTILFWKLLKSLTNNCLSMSGSAITTTGLRPK